ncbi:hypothetical protein [Paractinoplanes hotanensis]|uniref:Uncharacterized protein n=1 Tax=Paractinoplanes hotanensis TaxID=2906497 RepID=A0ABT0Y2N0_9ACTN|nr:hypothetical protein [Actinoplanes hotanensis]MCM4079594.1 hypothetical protein [Actinoplanes hotanensis]
MGVVDRVARAAVRVAARRWPDDLAPLMREEWLAELASITGRRRAARKLAFAGSLAVSPAVDEPSWRDRSVVVGRRAATAAGVTLLAAVATNLARGSEALAPAILLLGVAALTLIGRRVRASIVLVAAALFAFLFVGNPVPMMPFMGAADIAPAVITWAVGVALALRWAASPGRRWVAVAGGAVALDLATAAGSAHAAAVLGVPAWTAPAWFPLALLPGDTVSFGPHFSEGAVALGGLQASGPAFHASEILLANAAVSAGPMLLCTAFLLAPALRRPAAAASSTRKLTHAPTGAGAHIATQHAGARSAADKLTAEARGAAGLAARVSGAAILAARVRRANTLAARMSKAATLAARASGTVTLAARVRRANTLAARASKAATLAARASRASTLAARASRANTRTVRRSKAATLAARASRANTLAARARKAATLAARVSGPVGAATARIGIGGRRVAVGLAAALGALAVAPALPVAGRDADVVLPKLLDNSAAFGFGFVEHPVGLGAVALLAAILAMRVADARLPHSKDPHSKDPHSEAPA